ncbi:MAG TPA: steryl acetyl hydrolase, partial [Planctomycetes bacterium]|nr:steryl acetyl hydrolase [Planctomycetota bacterium]
LNYRLAPEHPYPCAIEDAVAAVLQLQQEGVQPGRLFIAGDSAGGGLTLATLQTLREQNNPLPSAAVLLSPWVDLTLSGESIDPHAPFDYVERPALESLARNYADPQQHKN